eukprot:5778868-Pyramimonas_sp.AAC.1
MRQGKTIPDPVWRAFEARFAKGSRPDAGPELDPRHAEGVPRGLRLGHALGTSGPLDHQARGATPARSRC